MVFYRSCERRGERVAQQALNCRLNLPENAWPIMPLINSKFAKMWLESRFIFFNVVTGSRWERLKGEKFGVMR